MSAKVKTKLRFATLPRDYVTLCRIHLPRPIRDAAEYEATLNLAEVFAGFESEMTPDQTDYFEMLCGILEDWESAHAKWKTLPPLKILRHLLDEHGLSGTDLSRLLGASRALGPMILRGDRQITAEHARALGVHFGLPPGTFIA